MMGTMTEISNFLNFSPKRQALLDSKIGEFCQANADVEVVKKTLEDVRDKMVQYNRKWFDNAWCRNEDSTFMWQTETQ